MGRNAVLVIGHRQVTRAIHPQYVHQARGIASDIVLGADLPKITLRCKQKGMIWAIEASQRMNWSKVVWILDDGWPETAEEQKYAGER